VPNAAQAVLHATTWPPEVTRIASGQSTGRVQPPAEQPVGLSGSLVVPPPMLMYIGRFAPSTMLTS